MLILTRKLGEGITIGNDIEVAILGIRGKQIKLGIDAPPETLILRNELIPHHDNVEPKGETHE